MPYGLIGHPLGHSLSPRLHQLLCAASGQTISYELIDLSPEEIPHRLPQLLAEYDGLNVTIPYKQTVIPFLTRLDESAARYDSVNTIDAENGVGYNTDCVGFTRSIDALCPSFLHTDSARRALIIGAGGVGRMFAIELARHGCDVVIGVRPSSLARAEALAAEISGRYGVSARAAKISSQPMSAADAGDGHFDLLVNASPCGMFPHPDECPVEDALLQRCSAVFDSIYNPRRTRLLLAADRFRIPALGGMRMLVCQAAAAQEYWIGAHFSKKTIEQITEQLELEVNP